MTSDEIIRNYDLLLIDAANLTTLLNEREWYEASRYARRILDTLDLFRKSRYDTVSRVLDSTLED